MSPMQRLRESLEQRAFVEILRTYGGLHDELSALLKEQSLSEPQFNVLRILRGARPNGLPCQAVAERMITRYPDITRLLDRLEASGLIERARSRDDRRVVVVTATRKALELLARLDRPVAKLHLRQLGHMTRAALKELIRLLEKARAEA
jgi:DNA-binding MarR family transcriptional regulator